MNHRMRRFNICLIEDPGGGKKEDGKRVYLKNW